MKAQSQIIQYVLFFLIGLSIFGLVGNFYKSQAESLRERIANDAREMISSYIAAYAIYSFSNCKYCNSSNFTIDIPNVTAGYYHEIYLLPQGLMIKSVPSEKAYYSTIHNLNQTLNFYGFSQSTKPIVLSLIKNQNKLVVS